MARLARSVATLRVIEDNLVPERISSVLGCTPTHAQRKGDRVPMRESERVVGFGSWRLDATDTEPEEVDSQVSEILAKLTSNLEAWRALGKQFRVELFCGWFMDEGNEDLSISPGNMIALGARGIECNLIFTRPALMLNLAVNSDALRPSAAARPISANRRLRLR